MSNKKDITVIQGDSYDLGIRVSGASSAINLAAPGTLIRALITDASGTRPVVPFEVEIRDAATGHFVIHLDPDVTRRLRGKYLWFCRLERGDKTTTLASGAFNVRVV